MKIYTKGGDQFKTSTFGRRVFKDDLIIEVSGTIDELQSFIMVAYNQIENEDIRSILLASCKNLFTIGFDIISMGENFTEDKTTELEHIIDKYDALLPKQKNFIVPGLTKGASFIHAARTVARRCERVIVHFALENFVNPSIIQYMNRLSDLFYVLGRFIEEEEKVKK